MSQHDDYGENMMHSMHTGLNATGVALGTAWVQAGLNGSPGVVLVTRRLSRLVALALYAGLAAGLVYGALAAWRVGGGAIAAYLAMGHGVVHLPDSSRAHMASQDAVEGGRRADNYARSAAGVGARFQCSDLTVAADARRGLHTASHGSS